MRLRDEQEILRADPRLRKRLLTALVVTSLSGTVVLFILQGMLANLQNLHGEAFERARNGLAAAFTWSIAGSVVLAISASVWLWRVGSRSQNALQFPPPGLRVVRDIVILRGEQAVRRGRLLQILAAALLLSTMGLLAAAWRVYELPGLAGAA